MKAVVVRDGKLVLEEKLKPVPGENEISIKVIAAGVNRPDVYQRMGNYPAPSGVDPDVPGLEVSGIVESIGKGVESWKAGDRVCALLAGGGYAEYAIVDQRQVLSLPDTWSFEEGAGLCETLFTVWSNVFMRAHFREGEHVVVHGGSSGIGSMAIPLVKVMGGRISVTAGTDEKCRFCESLGADLAVNYKTSDFLDVISSVNGKADIILDMVGADYTARNIKLLNAEGRLVIINAMSGRHTEIDLIQVMLKRLTITGSTLRSRDAAFKGEIRDEIERLAGDFLLSRQVVPIIYQILPMVEAQKAHEIMEESSHMGKIVLSINGG